MIEIRGHSTGGGSVSIWRLQLDGVRLGRSHHRNITGVVEMSDGKPHPEPPMIKSFGEWMEIHGDTPADLRALAQAALDSADMLERSATA